MRVFLDENMPRAHRHVLPPHSVSSVEDKNWKGKDNGELLELVEREFDVFLTADNGIASQKPLLGRKLSIVVVPTNRWSVLIANIDALCRTLAEMERHSYRVPIVIGWDGRRILRRLDQSAAEDVEMEPVAPFSLSKEM